MRAKKLVITFKCGPHSSALRLKTHKCASCRCKNKIEMDYRLPRAVPLYPLNLQLDTLSTSTLPKELHAESPCIDVLSEVWQRYAFANDAGPYLLIPQAVMQPRTESEVQAIFKASQKQRIPISFRAGGTSLSGQSVTDGWLVDIGRHWRKIERASLGRRNRRYCQRHSPSAWPKNWPRSFFDQFGHDGRYLIQQLERNVLRSC